MASGLAALLDDVAMIAKLAAASLDDIGAAAGKASVKAAGVVVDDAAVTPRYVTGFTPARELPVIGRIARGSLINKIAFILPAAMLLSAFLPAAITPILMLGGAYLCFEGVEKLAEALSPRQPEAASAAQQPKMSSAEHEATLVSGAVRTDFILSAEIMAIALAEVSKLSLAMQAASLFVVALLITALVYGVVALIVKMDDVGLHLAKGKGSARQAVGRALVTTMPKLLKALSAIGVAAMIWVGGGIILHGMHEFHLTPLPEWLDHATKAAATAAPFAKGFVGWLVHAIGSGLFGCLVGGIIVAAHHLVAGKSEHH